MKVFGRFLTLRMRLTIWLASLLAVGMAVFGISGYVGLRTYLKKNLQESFASTAHVLTANYLSRLPEKSDAWVYDQMRQFYPPAKTQRLIRVSTRGSIFYQTGSVGAATSIFDSIPIATTIVPEGAFHRFPVANQIYMVYSLPYQAPDGRPFEVEIAGSLSNMMQTLRSLQHTLLMSLPLILLFSVFGGQAIMKRPLRPLSDLTEQADKIGRHELGERLPEIATGDELERLATSLNRMIARLEEALEHNRRFSADASHELRTPLTILQGEMEDMLRHPNLPLQVAGNAVSALEEIERMSHLVQSLMDITRVDAGGELMRYQSMDLAALARTTVDQMQVLADASDVPLLLNAPDNGAVIVADPFRIKQILVNLIDNAIKYTGADEGTSADRSVLVRITNSAETVVFEVIDHGIGISESSLPNIFDRFYRADSSRNRTVGGVGLGLSIVKAVVSAHGGTIKAIRNEVGTTLRVELPHHDQGTPTQTRNFADSFEQISHVSQNRQRPYVPVQSK